MLQIRQCPMKIHQRRSPKDTPSSKESQKDLEPISEDDEEPEDPSAEIIQLEDLDNKTVSQHRKAYVNWINNVFYERIKDLNSESPLKIYQTLVQKYLAFETPYRGLLVYHGLGTGKTATAISLAEGLRGQMRINTFLPASLEGNFIGEIMGDKVKGKMGWGKDELNIDNTWKFVKISEIDDDFKDSYKLDSKVLRKIQNETVNSIKKLNDKNLEKKSKSIRGFFIPDKNGLNYDELEIEQQEFLKKELEYLIKTKYNFIHYNPFPKVKSDKIKYTEDDEEDEDIYLLDEEDRQKINTNNMKIVKDLDKRLKFNKKILMLIPLFMVNALS